MLVLVTLNELSAKKLHSDQSRLALYPFVVEKIHFSSF